MEIGPTCTPMYAPENGSAVDATGRNLSAVLEPFLLLVVWVAVVFVALGVILPIYSLIDGINHR